MDFMASGIFTAPRMGIYLFVEEANTIANQNDQLTLQSTLNLEKGDQVWVVIDPISSGVSLYDSCAHYRPFYRFFVGGENCCVNLMILFLLLTIFDN